MFGLAFYAAMGTAAIYAALTESGIASRGLATIETTLRAAAGRDADVPHHPPYRPRTADGG